MDSFIARQPIFDHSLDIYGYELLYRSRGTTHYDHPSGNMASASVIADGLLGIGIKAMTGGNRAFINFTHDMLINEVATILPKSMIAVEILEDVLPTTEIVAVCEKLKESGYMLVLDDFVLKKEFNPLIDFADIIKVDFMSTTEKMKKYYRIWLQTSKTKLLAEKVESHEAYQQARDLGYSYFQGYFFGKPEVLAALDFPAFKQNYFRMMQEAGREEVDFGQLENLIKTDVSMSYKLLKLVNSAFFGLPTRIESIRQALTLMGTQEVKRWLFLLALTLVASEKPHELIRLSLIRANFCEALGLKIGLVAQRSEFFLTGLFSLIEGFLNRPMEDILAELPVSENIKVALLHYQGPMGIACKLILAYERGDWDAATQLAADLKINPSEIPPIYFKAIEQSNAVFGILNKNPGRKLT